MCLINSFLSSLPLFFQSFYKILKEVCSKLVGIHRRFLFVGGGGGTQKLLGSSDICKSKKLEGLEVNDILVFNEAMWGK